MGSFHVRLSVGIVQTCLVSITDCHVQLHCCMGGLALGGADALLGCLVPYLVGHAGGAWSASECPVLGAVVLGCHTQSP